jgi:acetylornithine/N-succinyldiaminopimelate aminotransferase
LTSATFAPLLPTYARADVMFVEGEGAWLVAADGRRYLDFAAGIAVVGLGHSHPDVTAAPPRAARAALARLQPLLDGADGGAR